MTERLNLITGLVESLKSRAPFAASTDRAGVLRPNSQQVLKLYSQLALASGLPNPLLEFIHFRFTAEHASAHDIAGFHSKIGAPDLRTQPTVAMKLDAAKVRTLNAALHHSDTTMREAGTYGVINDSPIYAVHHTDHVSRMTKEDLFHMKYIQRTRMNALHNGNPGVIVAVENGIERGALERVKNQPHELAEKDIIAIRLVDLCHIMRVLELETQHGYTNKTVYFAAWKKMVRILESLANEPILMHMPIGTLLSDSLLFKYIDQRMLNDVFDVLAQTLFFMTIENQSRGALIHANPVKDTAEYDRLMPIFAMLGKAGAFQRQKTV